MPVPDHRVPLNSARTCARCGYALCGVALDADCPECGRPLAEDDFEARDRRWGRVTCRTRSSLAAELFLPAAVLLFLAGTIYAILYVFVRRY